MGIYTISNFVFTHYGDIYNIQISVYTLWVYIYIISKLVFIHYGDICNIKISVYTLWEYIQYQN